MIRSLQPQASRPRVIAALGRLLRPFAEAVIALRTARLFVVVVPPPGGEVGVITGGRDRFARRAFDVRLPQQFFAVDIRSQQPDPDLGTHQRREIGRQPIGLKVEQFQEHCGELDEDHRSRVIGREIFLPLQHHFDFIELHLSEGFDMLPDERFGELPRLERLIECPVDAQMKQQPPVAEAHLADGKSIELFVLGPGQEQHMRRQPVIVRQPEFIGFEELQRPRGREDPGLAVWQVETEASQPEVLGDHPFENPL